MQLDRSRTPAIAKPLVITLAAAAIVFAHLYTHLLGDRHGPLLVLDHLFHLAATLFLIACFTAAGWRVLRAWGLVHEDPIQTLVFSTALGAGLIGTAILVLGFVPGPLALDIGALLVACALLARGELIQLPELGRKSVAHFMQRVASHRLGFVALAALGAAAVCLVILALAPPADWDSLMYHVDIPVEFLRQGRIFVPEDNLHVSHIGLAHMLYLPLLAAGCANGPALLGAAMAILLGVAALSLAERSFGKMTAALSLLLVWGTTTVLLVAITPKVDVTLALFLLLSHYAVLCAFDSGAGDKHLLLAAAFLGFAFAIKYNALLYGLGLAPLVVVAARQRAGSLRAAARPALSFGLVAACVAIPWLVKNWILLGAPLYPLLSQPLLQPWLSELFASEAILDSIDPMIFEIWWEARVPFNLWDAFFNPERITIEAEGSAYYANPVFLLLPLGAFLLKNKQFSGLVLPPLAYLLLLLIPFPLTNLRYLLPAIAPLTIAVAFLLWRLSGFLPDARIREFLLALLALAALVPTGRTVYRRLTETTAPEHAVGLASADDYLSTHPLPEVRFYSLTSRFVNSELPPNSRILMLFETRGLYIEREVLQDNIATNWPILAAALGPDDCLEETGITHVLVGIATLRYMIAGGVDPAYFEWDRFQEFADRCLRPIWEGPGVVVYRHTGRADRSPG